MYTKATIIAVAMIFGCASSSLAAGSCSAGKANASHQCRKVAAMAHCCCNTRNGQCCAEVVTCGNYIPGCFCSHHKPDLRELSRG